MSESAVKAFEKLASKGLLKPKDDYAAFLAGFKSGAELALGEHSKTIRAAYEVLFGCLQAPEIAQRLDIPTVKNIAAKLNALLPGPDQLNS